MQPILILRKVHPDFREWKPDVPQTLKLAWIVYPLPKWEPLLYDELLELLFGIYNGHGSGPDHIAMGEAYYAAGNMSLSVGDVVILEDGAFACASAGWTRVDVGAVSMMLDLPYAD